MPLPVIRPSGSPGDLGLDQPVTLPLERSTSSASKVPTSLRGWNAEVGSQRSDGQRRDSTEEDDALFCVGQSDGGISWRICGIGSDGLESRHLWKPRMSVRNGVSHPEPFIYACVNVVGCQGDHPHSSSTTLPPRPVRSRIESGSD